MSVVTEASVQGDGHKCLLKEELIRFLTGGEGDKGRPFRQKDKRT